MFSLRVDEDLELELQDASRVEEAFAVILANYEHIHEWSFWLNEDFTLEKAREFWEKDAQKSVDEADEISFRIIYQGEIVGSIDFHGIDQRNKSGEIGCWVAKKYNGRGFAKKSVARMLDYGFDELKLNRIVVRCVVENAKSRRIPERLGFAQEGIEREALWLHARFVDFVVYSMLAKEWKNRNSGFAKNVQLSN